MSSSFFAGKDYARLYTGSIAFSTQISATPTVFGLTSAMATSYASLNDVYAAAYLAADDPATRTKGKIIARSDSATALRKAASDLAKIISGTPTVTNEQKADLGLSVRATPTPVPDPGTPTSFKVQLDGGALVLKWKCVNPRRSAGTMYQVWREIDGGPMVYVGGSGSKTFTDTTVPAGSAVVTYNVQAVRSTATGAWATFVVTFGNTGATPTVTETKPVKIAA
jgi:hypothetical protein